MVFEVKAISNNEIMAEDRKQFKKSLGVTLRNLCFLLKASKDI
jgi:hypothetical protein